MTQADEERRRALARSIMTPGVTVSDILGRDMRACCREPQVAHDD